MYISSYIFLGFSLAVYIEYVTVSVTARIFMRYISTFMCEINIIYGIWMNIKKKLWWNDFISVMLAFLI